MGRKMMTAASLNILEIVKRAKSFWKYINENDERYVFWVTILYYFISTLNLNNKTLFISLLGLWSVYHLRFKNIRHSLLFTALASLIFLVGKTWIVELISPKLLRSTDFPRGYITFIIVTPFQIFASLILTLLIRDVIIGYGDIRNKLIRLFSQPAFIFLFLFFFWQILSALMSENIYSLALIYSLQSLSYLVVFVALILNLSLDFSYYSKVASLFGAMVVFQAGLAAFQWLRRSTLGLAIEATEQALTYLKGPGQGFFSIRSIGTFSHPNELGLFSLFMGLLFLPFLYLSGKQLKKNKIFYRVFLSAAVFILILSLSRAAWLSFFLCLLLFLYVVEKKWEKHIIKLINIKTKRLLYLFLFLAIFSPLVISRTISSFDLFKPTGGGETRLRLFEESLNLIKSKPIFGTGMGLSGYAMFKYNPRGIIATFPSVVHNFYLLLASESGIPALVFFLLFVVFLIKMAMNKLKAIKIDDKIKLLGALIGLLSFLVNGMIHQIFLMGFFLITGSLLFDILERQPLIREGK